MLSICFIFATFYLTMAFRVPNSKYFMKVRTFAQENKQIEVTVTNLDNGEIIKIPSGSPLSLAAVRSGMRLSFQCKQGTCQSCETILDGYRSIPMTILLLLLIN